MPDTPPQSAPAGRKPLSRSEAARHASLVRWGKEQPFAARLEAIRQARKQRKAKGKTGGKGKGKAGAKPKQTPEERQAEHDKQSALNRTRVSDATDLGDDAANLHKFAQGGELKPQDGEALAKLGLVETASDGAYRLSAAGRAYLSAAERGDVRGAKDALSRGRDAVSRQNDRETAHQQRETAHQQRETERAQRKQEVAQRRAEREQARAARQKKRAKAQGKQKRTAADKTPAHETPGDKNRASTYHALDIAEDARGALDALASGTQPEDDGGIVKLGLAERTASGALRMTPAGRALIAAAARGDTRAARAALDRSRRKPSATKTEDLMTDYAPILDELTAIADELAELSDTDDAIKAGKRHSASDMAHIQALYDAGQDICDLAVALGATPSDDTDVEDMGADAEDLSVETAAKVASRDDVSPKEGESAYGDVTFADEKNKKYPLDTEAHIRSAWSYINQEKNAGKYSPEDQKTIKGKIVAAWKRVIDKAGPPSAATKTADDAYAVKALDNGNVGAYAVLFGTADTPDLSMMRDYFTKATDYWLDKWQTRPMLYHHAMDDATADDPVVGTWIKAEVDDAGVWLEGQLAASHKYRAAIQQMIAKGALALSSDSAPHLVRRRKQANGTHEVTRWPLLAASLTPTPAEPRLLPVETIKAAYKAIGFDVDIDDASEASTIGDSGSQSVDERARKLLLLNRILELEIRTHG